MREVRLGLRIRVGMRIIHGAFRRFACFMTDERGLEEKRKEPWEKTMSGLRLPSLAPFRLINLTELNCFC